VSGTGFAQQAKKSPPETPIAETEPPPAEVQVYRVRITVAFSRDESLTASFRQDFIKRMRGIAQRTYGFLWETQVVEDQKLAPATAGGLARLTAEGMEPIKTESPVDREFRIVVERSDGLYHVGARVWNETSRELSVLESVDVRQRRLLAEQAFVLVSSLFEPTVVIESVEYDQVEMRIRGGAIRTPDSRAFRLTKGSFVRPVFRYLDREKKLRQIQTLPWTYVVLETVKDGRATGTVISGLRSPLGTGRVRRVEIVGVTVRARRDATHLKLTPRSNPKRVLAGQPVSLVRKLRSKDEAKREPVRLISDRQGIVVLPRDDSHPLVWAYVRSGKSVLARVPIVSGAVASATIELPDDSNRLKFEGQVSGLKGRLIDAVALRSTLMSRIRIYGRGGDWDKVDAEMKQLDNFNRTRVPEGDRTLYSMRDFASKLTSFRVVALKRATLEKNRLAQARIKKMSDEASKLIAHYLNPEQIKVLKEEMKELKKLDKSPGKDSSR
jgi:hypothetical protein